MIGVLCRTVGECGSSLSKEINFLYIVLYPFLSLTQLHTTNVSPSEDGKVRVSLVTTGRAYMIEGYFLKRVLFKGCT